MANSVTTQLLQDGERNVVLKVVGILDTGNYAKATLLDISTLVPEPARVSLVKAIYSVQEPLSVNLYWDATTDVPIIVMAGTDHQDFRRTGPLSNNGGAGLNGDVLMETTGYSAGTVTFYVDLWFTKGNLV